MHAYMTGVNHLWLRACAETRRIELFDVVVEVLVHAACHDGPLDPLNLPRAAVVTNLLVARALSHLGKRIPGA